MNIELDSIPLIQNGQAGGEVRNVSNISTSDRRSIVELEIPGMEGNVFQDLGRAPVKISFDGTLQGKTARSNIEIIRSKFKQGKSLPFISNISGAADITKVLIEDLRINEVAGVTDRYNYSIVLREYKEPPPEPVPPPSQEEQAKAWAEDLAEDTIESLNYVTGKVLDRESNIGSGLWVVATGDEGEYRVQTDGDGIYRFEELPPGKYKIKVDSDDYLGVEEVVIIGKGEGSEEKEESGAEESGTEEEMLK